MVSLTGAPSKSATSDKQLCAQIDQFRVELEAKVGLLGFSHPDVVKHSQQLDQLIYQAQLAKLNRK
ncbi:aspartyl-phosphate phosphatase Spo0E family protein [Bacillus sp. FSL K6-6540]|uniref:aspartyl-phosphate phosphatase Spo0E family protein n=1 Tax=Bacillus sp. FSL K6-6540 TaxID=2921512 RepID=UPI0030F7E80C